MVVICAAVGIQQVALKSVSGDMSPVLQLAVRSGIAALLLAVVMRWRKDSFSVTDGTLIPGLGLGTLFSLEYLFLGEALRFTSASRVVVFLYCAPLVAAAVLHVIRKDEQLARVQWLGILFAFTGLALALKFGESPVTGSEGLQWRGDVLAILAGIAWGLSTVVVRTTRLADIPATRTLWYQLTTALILLMLAAIVLNQTQFTLSPALVWNLLFQGIVVAFGSFLVWLMLLKRYVASELGVLGFLTPVFGVLFGVVLLNEPLQLHFVIGAMMVAIGIVLVSSGCWILKKLSH